MDDLQADLNAEKEFIVTTLDALDEAMGREDITIIELTAMASFVQNIYSGIENLLKRVMKDRGIPVPHSISSHKDMLIVARNKNLISEEVYIELDVYRAFRHFYVHGYGVMLNSNKLMPLAENIRDVWIRFEGELDEYVSSKVRQKKIPKKKK